jgi:Domain of unknown function (DUF5671)
MEPTQKPRMTPKDFFVQFGALVTLYVSTGALLNLLFTLIDRVFSDALDPNYYYSVSAYSSGMRFAIAALVIIFPTYLILLWLITRDSESHPEKKFLGLRRWFTYLTLFLSAALALGDLVTLLNYFLSGEITTRFILKVLTVLVIAVGIFLYYIFDLRKQSGALKTYKISAATSVVAVVASIIWGFTVMGLPQSQRAQQLDMTRINDLQSIQSQVTYYYQQKNAVPANLAALVDPISNYVIPNDPETKLSYQYEKLSATSFKLCANFATAVNSADGLVQNASVTSLATYPAMPSGINQNWQHDKGTVCFTRTIDPQLYPQNPQTKTIIKI